jgi:hypothetical protein
VPTEYELGLLVGLLIGEGHFGGDGKQPQVTLRMHVRHEALFRWLETTFPGGRLYGPYDHSGRHYYQWMARGSFLRDELVPLIQSRIVPELDAYAFLRFAEMQGRYAAQLVPRPDSGHVLPRESSSDVRVPTSEKLTDAATYARSNGGVPLESSPADSPGPDETSGEREVAGQRTRSAESMLSRGESIFSRMREEGTPQSTGG